MSEKDFIMLIRRATEDDETAVYEIIQMYEKLIHKNSYISGKYDEDCKSYIEIKLMTAIKKFRLLTNYQKKSNAKESAIKFN